jgi:outer membrane receptor protein involved in Fe transport
MDVQSLLGRELHQAVLHLPILTTLLAAFFAVQVFARYRRKGGLHLYWWGIGLVTYGVGTALEAATTLFGWQPLVFRAWYVAGAFLGGYPLAQGSIYLHASERFAQLSARIVPALIAVAGLLVFLSPLDPSLAESHRLSGRVLEWSWLRWVSPWINLYSVVFLVGGAVVSALRFRRDPSARGRFQGNVLIAVGALLPGIGGSLTRAGFVEALYVTELIGLVLVWIGYRRCLAEPAPAAGRALTALAGASLLAATLVAAPALAETTAAAEADATADADGQAEPEHSFFESTTVTALGRETDAFEVATPVTVIPALELERRMPDNAAELLRDEPGVDVNGVGANQARPVIRGQRGLRVLFLEDGLRLNNPRRQTDFGEISGLVDLGAVETVEIVRGPASVLYGSDAIGGVLNLIPKLPGERAGRLVGGHFEARYGEAGDATRLAGALDGRRGAIDFQLGGSWRDSEDYEAPDGEFGRIRLAGDTPVVDTGVADESLWGSFGWALDSRSSLRLRFNRYRADQSGFGFVEPAAIGESEDFRIRILYPFQDFDRYTLSYDASALELAPVDALDARLYFQSNERALVNDIDINIGPVGPGFPDSSVAADSRNFTDLDTWGTRLEAIKILFGEQVLTYGAEAYRDDSFNTDRSVTVTTIRFPFPPFQVLDTQEDTLANAPNAENTSWGVFVQDEIPIGERFRVTAGVRYQKVETRAESTPGWDVSGLDFEDDAVVGAVTGTWQITEALNLLASYGTAFRAPNIIERLFNGPTPEGAGFQILNPALESEQSGNWDVGFKYRRRNAFVELVAFRNDVEDGVIQYFLSPAEVAALPAATREAIAASGAQFVVQQRNAERLRYEGIELALGYRFENGLTLGGSFTTIDGERLDSTNPPTGDTYSDKLVGYARYEAPSGRFWGEYRIRHNGSQDANLDPNEPPPAIGTVLPAFTLHSVAGGVTLFERAGIRHQLQLAVENLTDELYAEFSNATFFRPEPGRSVQASYRVRF